MWESVKFIRKLKPDNTATFVFYPFPETESYTHVEDSGLIDELQRKSIFEGFGSYHTIVMIGLCVL